MMDNLEYKVPFYMIANDIFELGLNPYQISVYSYLCRCSNNSTAFPSYQTIAKKTGMSKSKAIRTTNELIEINLIQKIIRKKSNDDNETNIYRVNVPSVQHTSGGVQYTTPDVQYTTNKELPKKNYLKRTKNIGNFDKQNSAYYFKDFKKYLNQIDKSVEYYIEFYLKTKEEKYTIDIWHNIINNLEQFLISVDFFEDIESIVNQYFKNKFDNHTLYHSSLNNVLMHRMQEIGLLSYVE